MPLNTPTYFCTQADLEAVLSAHGVRLRLDDDQSGTATSGEIAYLTLIRGWASETVLMYCNDRYAPSILATSPLVNGWTTYLAAYELCFRRGNAVPDPIQAQAERTEDTLREIQEGRLRIPGVPVRRITAPVWSNVRFNPHFQFNTIRVERRTSSPIRTDLKQIRDLQSDFWVEL